MKFKQLLFEDYNDKKKVFTIILQYCKPILSSDSKLLLRGIKHESSSVLRKTTRTDRKPLDTSPLMQRFIDDAFERRFNKRLRSTTVFSSLEDMQAMSYGVPYILIPVGKTTYYGSRIIQDLNEWVNYYMGTFLDKFPGSDKVKDNLIKAIDGNSLVMKLSAESLTHKINDIDNVEHILEAFSDCITSIYEESNNPLDYSLGEQMVDCKEYYLVTKDYFGAHGIETYEDIKKIMTDYIS
jgi:hypothetical protein